MVSGVAWDMQARHRTWYARRPTLGIDAPQEEPTGAALAEAW